MSQSRKPKIDFNWLLWKLLVVLPRLILVAYVLNVLIRLVFKTHPETLLKNDFVEYWAASSLALDGKAWLVYDFSEFQKVLIAISGKAFPMAWFYPPSFLLLIMPLALVPYYLSMALWLGCSVLAYILVVRAIAPHRLAIWVALAFPGALVNLNYGQNGLFSTALLGSGLILIDRRPYLAGFLLGLLTYKPHLAILVPVALAAGRYWKVLATMVGTFGGLAFVSALVLGPEVWPAFWNNIPVAMKLLEEGSLPSLKMPSLFVATLLAGGGPLLARLLQGVVTLAVTVGVFRIWRSGAPFPIRASLLVLAALLSTPYVFEYDLALLALPLAWLGWEGHHRGWLPGEKLALILAWVTPFVPRLSDFFNVPLLITPFLLLLLFSFFLFSARASLKSGSSSQGFLSPQDFGEK
jgi:alpha-1,2-mannosyltransferase